MKTKKPTPPKRSKVMLCLKVTWPQILSLSRTAERRGTRKTTVLLERVEAFLALGKRAQAAAIEQDTPGPLYPICTYLPPDVYAKIKERAAAMGFPASALIRAAIDMKEN
jgi:hypothetical protein